MNCANNRSYVADPTSFKKTGIFQSYFNIPVFLKLYQYFGKFIQQTHRKYHNFEVATLDPDMVELLSDEQYKVFF